MNFNLNQQKWKKVKAKIQLTWCEFTEQEIELIHGDVQRLALALEKKYGTSTEEAQRQAELFKQRYEFIWPGKFNCIIKP